LIPYQELCDALARWRSRNGLRNGPSATVRFTSTPTVVSSSAGDLFPPEEAMFLDAPTTVSVPEEGLASPSHVLHAAPFLDAPIVAVDEPPADAAGEAPVTPVTFDGSMDEVLGDSDDLPAEHPDEELEDPTGLHMAPDATRPREETGEIDLDADMIDEDDL
jgi:hypothetical protein